MTGVQAIVVVTAVLLAHSANCRPLSFPFSQPSDTLGGSRFPNYDIPNPLPNYDQFDYQQYLDDLYGPFAQGRHGARTQARGQARHGNNQVASSEAFNKLAQFGQTILDYLVNRFSNRSSNARSMHAATAPVSRRPAHVQQGVDDIEGILTDILYDELVRDYVDGISPYLNDATEQATKAATKQVNNKLQAKLQWSSSFGDFFSRNWNTARECLNDVFGPDDARMSTEERQAAISEFRDVWTGRRHLSQASAQVRLNWPVVRDCVDRFVDRNNPNTAQTSWWGNCNVQLYIMAFTGGSQNALTTDPPFIELAVGSEVKTVQLPIVTGLEFETSKGDSWAIDLTQFGFTDTCITQWDVDGIAVLEGGTDGWLIDSIVTFLLDDEGSFSLLSSDIDVDVWIDGNGGEERRRFDLTLD